MKNIDKTIGRRIAELRRLAGLSQARLADSIGTATETISRLETGAAMPSLARLAAIARVLGVELHQLVRVRPGGDPQHAALERLVLLMSRRTAGEIELVVDVAASVLDHIGQFHPTPG
jgi:transcriptional regulator with XRE-family HTH domain